MLSLTQTLRRTPSLIFVPLIANAALVVVGFFLCPGAAGPFFCSLAAAAVLAYLYVSIANGVIRVRSQEFSVKRHKRMFWASVAGGFFFYATFTFYQCVFIWG